MPVSDSPSAAATAPAAPGMRAGAYAWYVLAVLVVIYILNFMDRQILSILAEDIKVDLKLDDAQLGFLYGTAFAVFYALFGIPLGRMADMWYRGRLIAIGLTLWSSMTIVSGLATSYGQLAGARTAVGIGEASASPAAFSLLADYFPARQRALVASIYSAGVFIGSGISLPLGGWISGAWNRAYATGPAPFDLHGWQVAFMAVGAPGLLMAVWILTIREPRRGAMDGVPAPVAHPDAWRRFSRELMAIIPPLTFISVARLPGELPRAIGVTALIALVVTLLAVATSDVAQWIVLGTGVHAVHCWTVSLRHADRPTWTLTCGSSTALLAVLGIGLITFVTYAFTFWIAPLAIRNFGVSKELIGVQIGLPGAAMSILGIVGGGFLSDWWKARDVRGRVFVLMLGIGLPAPFMAAMYLAPSFDVFRAVAPATYLLSAMWVGSAVTVMQDLVLPRMRGVASSAYLLGSTMIGLGLGPYCAGKLGLATGSLTNGLLCVLAMVPVALLVLAAVARQVGACEAGRIERARLAGEPV